MLYQYNRLATILIGIYIHLRKFSFNRLKKLLNEDNTICEVDCKEKSCNYIYGKKLATEIQGTACKNTV